MSPSAHSQLLSTRTRAKRKPSGVVMRSPPRRSARFGRSAGALPHVVIRECCGGGLLGQQSRKMRFKGTLSGSGQQKLEKGEAAAARSGRAANALSGALSREKHMPLRVLRGETRAAPHDHCRRAPPDV